MFSASNHKLLSATVKLHGQIQLEQIIVHWLCSITLLGESHFKEHLYETFFLADLYTCMVS